MSEKATTEKIILDKIAILLIDHGSKKSTANEMLVDIGKMMSALRPKVIVEIAHMELADPNIAAGFAKCVKRGASFIKIFPYMLSQGRHVSEDVPRLVQSAAEFFPHITYEMLPPFGLHPKIVEIILERASL